MATNEPGKHIPDHWGANSWEQKAQENPLHAIMTIPEFRGMRLEDLKHEIPPSFLAKGRTIYNRMILPFLSESERSRSLRLFDYGCGIGRIMRACIDAGHQAAGADISRTMLDNSPLVVPDAVGMYLVAEDGAVEAEDEAFDVSYSFAVLQHISSLSLHQKAVQQMARVLKPGGLLVVQVNCEDYSMPGDQPGWTMNYESFSVHFAWNSEKPVRIHSQDNWSGAYIGRDLMINTLNSLGLSVLDVWPWTTAKPRAMVFVARKIGDKDGQAPRPFPALASINAKRAKQILDKLRQGAFTPEMVEAMLQAASGKYNRSP